MTSLFVTASGTDVGKTFVMTQLIAALRKAGYRVRALKPIASGFDPAQPQNSDSGRLLLAQNLSPTAANLDAVTPWRFTAPLSPDMAAEREHRRIPFDALVKFCKSATDIDITLIEGIGGTMVPIDETHTVVDWIKALDVPTLLVVGSYLGTLSHALTASVVLQDRGCELAGVIVSESVAQPVTPEETAAVLQRFLRPVPVRVLPRLGSAGSTATLNWLELLEAHLRR
ncbi:MAG TPA: dethiobiotin synthase [Gammaproteobacteria bacterium]|nr:dethiobiotin synthase [Gammaproteobacteria bacterium]